MKVKKTIELSLGQKQYNASIDMVQGDSAREIVCLLTDVDISGTTVRFYARKPSGKEVFSDGVVESAGKAVIPVLESVLEEVGVVECQVFFAKETQDVTSFQFVIKVQENLLVSSKVTSSNDYAALKNLMNSVKPVALSGKAADLEYDNAISRLKAINTQAAIDEVAEEIDGVASTQENLAQAVDSMNAKLATVNIRDKVTIVAPYSRIIYLDATKSGNTVTLSFAIQFNTIPTTSTILLKITDFIPANHVPASVTTYTPYGAALGTLDRSGNVTVQGATGVVVIAAFSYHI